MRYQQCAAPPPDERADEFVMSDASVDRVGDVIEQSGWQLGNFRRHPIALFNHDRDQVIGRWADVGVREGRLTGRLELAEEGTSALVDSVRKLVRQKILRAVSVGFRALKREKLTEAADEYFGPFRFLKTELLECSLVSIPANPNALSTAKALAIPQDQLDQLFNGKSAKPGKSAARSLASKGMHMATLSQRIQSAQKHLNDLRDKLSGLAAKDDLTEEETEQAEELPNLIEEQEKELQRLERMEKALMPRQGSGSTSTAAGFVQMNEQEQARANEPARVEVLAPQSARSFVMPRKKVESGDLVIRAIASGIKSYGMQMPLDAAMRDMYGSDEATQIVLRAAVNPAMTTVAGWAQELVQQANAAFLDRLVADSIYQPLSSMGQRYDLGRNGSIKIPTRATTPRASGAWVGEGAPKPVKRIGLGSITLTPHKLAVISTFTEEMALYSTPAIEGLLRQAMSDDTSESLDGFLIDNVAASATRPAGLLNGVAGLTPSAAATDTAAMVDDLKALVGAIVANGGGRDIAILMNPVQALQVGLAQTTTGDFLFTTVDEAGNKFMARIIISNTVPAAKVIAVDAADFATITGDAPRFAVSQDATLHEEDTTPLAIGTPGAPATIAAPTRSLFQTDSIAVRLSLYLTWAMRRTGMVQFVDPVIW